ncbi:MAG: glycosyltransferase [Sphingobacteriaceae bacterium]|nr:glycosyltransferase [Cytophagaceae bacterium]
MLLLSGFAAFVLAIGIQLIFVWAVFSRTARYQVPERFPSALTPGVSVVVCAWNEAENLRQLLPLLLDQQYPDFEIVLVDDRSEDDTYEFLLDSAARYPNLRRVHIKQTPAHITAKKYALSLGIRAAQKEVILVTDADCRPASPQWIASMASQLSPDKAIVLGFSPYQKREGFLNAFIRFETFYTALQYVSLALAGSPFMGVGRNLLYRRSLFLENKGFNEHLNVLGGDDDLFINRVATGSNTAVCLDPLAFVWSFPKTSWQSWYRQKRRHLSVGKFYRPRFRRILGLLAASQVFTWLLFMMLVPAFTLRGDWIWLSLTLGLFLLRLVAMWRTYATANRRLGGLVKAWAFPGLDAVLVGYYAFMGSKTFFSRKKLTWR